MWRCVDLVWTDVSEERRFTQDLHGATSKKAVFFIAIEVSNVWEVQDLKDKTAYISLNNKLSILQCLVSLLHSYAYCVYYGMLSIVTLLNSP
jgi:hypothetical protein